MDKEIKTSVSRVLMIIWDTETVIYIKECANNTVLFIKIILYQYSIQNSILLRRKGTKST